MIFLTAFDLSFDFQQIMEAVAGNLNRLYAKFLERNPNFRGKVSVSGHSLGSLILFDLLQHQKPPSPERDDFENSENPDGQSSDSPTANKRNHPPLRRLCSQQINYTVGKAGTGQPFIHYPQLHFQPKHFFALGSPIGKLQQHLCLLNTKVIAIQLNFVKLQECLLQFAALMPSA